MERVTGPAPCLARFFPYLIRAARSRLEIRVVPGLRFNALSTARFDRRIGLPTSSKSAMCNSTRSANVRGFPNLLGTGSQPISISRSVSIIHSVAWDFNRNVREAYLPFRRTCALQFPAFVRTIVAMRRAVLQNRAKTVHKEIKRGTKPCNLVQFSARFVTVIYL